MADDIETGAEDLEGSEGAVVTQAELDALEDAADDRGTSTDDDAPTGNKWANRRSLSEMLEEEDAGKAGKPAAASSSKKPAAPTGTAEEEEGDVDGEDDLDDDDEDLEDPKRDAKKEEPKPADKKGESGKPRYTVKGGDGKSFAFELQPGTSIQFQGDGKPVEVKSIDELVQLAQKGVAFDRKTSEQGQTIAQLRTSAEKLQGNLKAVRETAERTLLAALFDRETRQKLRVALAPYRDPEYRKGIEAQQTLAEQEEREKETESQQIEEKRAEFWKGVGGDIREEIAKTDHLTPDDAMEVATRFHQGYAATYQAKFDELVAGGVAEEKAVAQANTHALSYFTEKNLRRVVRGLNAELAEERAAAGKKGKNGKPVAGDRAKKPGTRADADKAAQAHNRKLDDKLAQRRRSPRLQGGGALPGGSAAGVATRNADAPKKAPTYAQRMDRAFGMLSGDRD